VSLIIDHFKIISHHEAMGLQPGFDGILGHFFLLIAHSGLLTITTLRVSILRPSVTNKDWVTGRKNLVRGITTFRARDFLYLGSCYQNFLNFSTGVAFEIE
jgi:hypothetical protein